MRWLLDTNVVSDSVRDRPNTSVSHWVAAIPQDDAAISIVTFAELWDGATSSSDPDRRHRLTDWIEIEVSQRFQGRILALTPEVLANWLRLSRRLSARRLTQDAADLLIAATARVHNLALVTRNVRDFANTGIVVYDPWTGKTHRMEPP